MAVDVEFIAHNEYLEAIVTGAYDLNEAINKFSKLLDLCRVTGLDKVIIDYRELQREDSAVFKGLYAVRIEELYLNYIKSGGHELEIAYLGPYILPYEPGMEIAKQGELPIKLFDSPDEAMEWLDIKSTSKIE